MGLLSALAGGVSSYAKGRVAELNQDREFNMKKELLDIATEKEALIEENKAAMARKRNDATMGRVRDGMGPETKDVTVGDAKNESTMTGYNDENGVFQATKVNSPVTTQQPVGLGERFKNGLLNAIKNGDSEAYAAITNMYDNAQKLDKGEADISHTQAQAVAELRGKSDKTDFQRKLDALLAAGGTREQLLTMLGATDKPPAEEDPYRETPSQKAARENTKADEDLADEELKASITDDIIKKGYKAWAALPENFQHKTVKDFVESNAATITKEFARQKQTRGTVIPFKNGVKPPSFNTKLNLN